MPIIFGMKSRGRDFMKRGIETTKSKTVERIYQPNVRECREYDDRDNRMELTPCFVFIEGGGCEASITHRVFKKMVADYQKWEKANG